jgi:hypothetical protein
MSVIFLSPLGALIALGVLLPLAAMALVAMRADRLRTTLQVIRLPRRRLAVPAAAAALIATLVGVAAAQPVAQRETTLRVRTDAEVFVVVDISRSMLARSQAGSASRLQRAKAAAIRLRTALPGVPVGLASLTDRVLPHLFASADEDVFRATVRLAIDIERPPPRSSLLTTATNLTSLTALASQRFFSPNASKRVVVVMTDGESQSIDGTRLARFFHHPPGVSAVFVQFWRRDERVFTRGVPETAYRPDPGAHAALEGVAKATDGGLYSEDDVDAATAKVRSLLGSGPTVKQGEHRQRHALAPFLLAAAILPLATLLWRRDR